MRTTDTTPSPLAPSPCPLPHEGERVAVETLSQLGRVGALETLSQLGRVGAFGTLSPLGRGQGEGRR
jgi:hypothetical protein